MLILLIACLCVPVTSVAAPSKKPQRLMPQRARKSVEDERVGQSSDEKEFAALTHKLRVEDAAFTKELRHAGVGEKRK